MCCGDGESIAATHTLWWPPGKINGPLARPLARGTGRRNARDTHPTPVGLPLQIDLHRELPNGWPA